MRNSRPRSIIIGSGKRLKGKTTSHSATADDKYGKIQTNALPTAIAHFLVVYLHCRGAISIASGVLFGLEYILQFPPCNGPANQKPAITKILPLSLQGSLILAFSASCSPGLCVIFLTADTFDGNTGFIGNSAGVDGGD